MSKAITLSELNKALKPLLDSIQNNEVINEKFSNQISEIHSMLTNLHTKIDLLDQSKNLTDDDEDVKTPVKKTKKTTVVKKKKTTKKQIRTVDEPDQTNAADEVDQPDQPDVADDDEVEDKPVKRKPVKKTISKSSTKSTRSTKSKKSTEKKSRPINKCEFFKKMYAEDPDYFSTYITDEVKEEIHAENEDEWDDLPEDQLEKQKCTAYYHYMKDNHDSMLQAMKNSYIEDNNKKNPDIVTKELDD